MAYAKLVAFDRPLAGAGVPGQGGRVYTDKEMAARDEASYRRGVDDTRALADQALVELRADMQSLGDGVFQVLTKIEPALLAQLREALPTLAVDIARRLLAGYEPSADVVARLCAEALQELAPERENLELSVAPRDAALLEQLQPSWMNQFPGLRIRIEASLAPGDCQVRSRFGLTDARLATKLTALEHNLVST